MQIIEDETFGYGSAYWTNDELLNENSSLSENVNAKYSGFLSQPFSMIRMCSGSPPLDLWSSNCVSHMFNQEWSNAKELFSAGHIRDPSINQPGILNVLGPSEGTYSVSRKINLVDHEINSYPKLNCNLHCSYNIHVIFSRAVECKILDSMLSAMTTIRQDGDIVLIARARAAS